MKRILLMMIIALAAAVPVHAQTRKQEKAVRKEAATAAKRLKKEGYRPLELGKMESLLEKYFRKVNAGCAQVIGTADNCMSTNLAQVTALSNAATEYAMLAGGDVRGRIVSSASNLSGQEIDHIVASFERLVSKEIRGELVPYVTAVCEKKGRISVRAYCIIDVDAASRLRRQALEIALEEQSLAESYGSRVSEWIDEGFSRREE